MHANNDRLLVSIQEQIGKIVFSSMIIGSFPSEWSFGSYNRHLQDNGYALQCCILHVEKRFLREEQRAAITAELLKKLPGIHVKTYDTHVVLLWAGKPELMPAQQDKACRIVKAMLTEPEVQCYPGRILTDSGGLIDDYLKLKKQVIARDFPERERDEEIISLFALEEEFYDRVSDGNTEQLSMLLDAIAKRAVESQKIFLTDDKDVLDVVKSYFSFLWRSMIREIYKRTGKRKTLLEHITIDLEINMAHNPEELVELLQRFCATTIEMLQLNNTGSSHRIVEDIKAYVSSRCKEDISLKNVADEVGLSTYYISRLFKKEEGCNFKDYVISARMEKAMQLVREGKLNVNEIAREVGYSNPGYFSTAFHHYFGVTAKECLTRQDKQKKQ